MSGWIVGVAILVAWRTFDRWVCNRMSKKAFAFADVVSGWSKDAACRGEFREAERWKRAAYEWDARGLWWIAGGVFAPFDYPRRSKP